MSWDGICLTEGCKNYDSKCPISEPGEYRLRDGTMVPRYEMNMVVRVSAKLAIPVVFDYCSKCFSELNTSEWCDFCGHGAPSWWKQQNEVRMAKYRPKREFPVLYSGKRTWRRTVPWEILSAHKDRAEENHSQTLEELARRGGLDPLEMLAIIIDKPYLEIARNGTTRREAMVYIDGLIAALEEE